MGAVIYLGVEVGDSSAQVPLIYIEGIALLLMDRLGLIPPSFAMACVPSNLKRR